MDEQLTGAFAADIVTEELEIVLNLRGRAIVLRSGANRDGSERRSIVGRIVRLKRLVAEIQPRPRTLLISGLHLLRPHVVESNPRVVAQFGFAGILAGEDQRV